MNESTPGFARNPIATGIVGFCAGLIIAYGVGLWQRSAALDTQAEAHAQIIAAKDAQITDGVTRFEAAQLATRAAGSRTALVQARLGLFQAISDLDRRNFGVATERLREAATRFDEIDAAALGLDPAVLAGLRSEIAGMQVLMTVDFEQQRLQILELAARLDAQTAVTMNTAAANPAP